MWNICSLLYSTLFSVVATKYRKKQMANVIESAYILCCAAKVLEVFLILHLKNGEQHDMQVLQFLSARL